MTKFVLMVLLTLLCSVISGENVQAAATLPKEPVAENPVSIVIPRDLPLTLPEQRPGKPGDSDCRHR